MTCHILIMFDEKPMTFSFSFSNLHLLPEDDNKEEAGDLSIYRLVLLNFKFLDRFTHKDIVAVLVNNNNHVTPTLKKITC